MDLEHLLNTRACFSSLGQSSVIGYGIPDFLGMALDSPERRDLFLQQVGKAISNHEKRLQKVNVREEKKDTADRTLYFLIEGYLNIKGHESEVIFYSSLNHQNQRFKVNLEEA